MESENEHMREYKIISFILVAKCFEPLLNGPYDGVFVDGSGVVDS